jgi:hypothetical protein
VVGGPIRSAAQELFVPVVRWAAARQRESVRIVFQEIEKTDVADGGVLVADV